jgi:transcriptional regulator with XRE-family HTH domain
MTYTVRRLLPADVADMLRAARERLGLRLCDAALLAGINPSYLSAIERKRRCPSVEVARELAIVLGLGPGDTEALMQAAVPDAGRSHPDRRGRHDPTRTTRHLIATVLAGPARASSHRVSTVRALPAAAGGTGRVSVVEADSQDLA